MDEKILQIIEEVCDDYTIKDDINRDLIETNTLDSLGFIELITRLEDEFNIEIQPTQADSASWRTVNSITNFVKSIIK